MITIVGYDERYFGGVKSLWEVAFPDDPPWNRAENAIPAKVAFQPDLFFVALDGEQVVGTAMAGYDGHRGWLYAIAVLPDHRRRGVASALVRRAEADLRELGCRKINLQVRASNADAIAVYRGLGYEIEDRISLGKRV
jgi:ribosomal protein S18 acetylase RimI-like enzyme